MDGSSRGLLLVLLSALTFGSSGPFAKALLDAGWTPGAAVTVRATGAALVLGGWLLARRRAALRRVLAAPRTVLGYGVGAVAAAQLCYFSAVQTLAVGTALLIEYLAPVLVVGWLWLRTGRRPSGRTLGGGALALVGTAGVLDVTGARHVDPVGVAWALGAAVGLACYFLVLGADRDGEAALDPAALAGAGLVVGAATIGLAGVTGLLPVGVGGSTAVLAGHAVPVWLPVAALVLVSTVVAYLAGAAGMARMGATAGSIVSLSEVLFAVLAAWLFLGEWPTWLQLGGGGLVVTGVVLARVGAAPPAVPVPAERTAPGVLVGRQDAGRPAG